MNIVCESFLNNIKDVNKHLQNYDNNSDVKTLNVKHSGKLWNDFKTNLGAVHKHNMNYDQDKPVETIDIRNRKPGLPHTNKIIQWIHDNPGKASAIGAATAAGLGALAFRKKIAEKLRKNK